MIVDSTVQEKAVAHPTDSKLLETARSKVVEVAKAHGIELKQIYAKEGQLLGYKAGPGVGGEVVGGLSHVSTVQKTKFELKPAGSRALVISLRQYLKNNYKFIKIVKFI